MGCLWTLPKCTTTSLGAATVLGEKLDCFLLQGTHYLCQECFELWKSWFFQRSFFNGISLNDIFYVTGGSGGSTNTEVLAFNPAAEDWGKVGDMQQSRSRHAVTLVRYGDIQQYCTPWLSLTHRLWIYNSFPLGLTKWLYPTSKIKNLNRPLYSSRFSEKSLQALLVVSSRFMPVKDHLPWRNWSKSKGDLGHEMWLGLVWHASTKHQPNTCSYVGETEHVPQTRSWQCSRKAL